MNKKAQSLKEKIAALLPDLEEPFLSTEVFAKICSLQEFENLRHADFSALSVALRDFGYQQTALGPALIQGRETSALMWKKGPQERLCGWHEQFEPCRVCKIETAERDAESAARQKQIDDGIAQLERLASESEEEDDDDTGPQSRGVVVLDRRLERLKVLLQRRNMIVLVAPADDIDDESRAWLLPHRVVIVEDETPLVDDASSYEYGIISCRLLSSREPDRVAKIVSDAFVHGPKLWHRRHGWKLVLRDDGEHEYEPLVD